MRLLSFSITNFKSFNKKQSIQFSESSGNKNNVTVIVGPNSSGKSNLFKALAFFRQFILNSTQYGGRRLFYEPFLLKDKVLYNPTVFEAEFKNDDFIYNYNFSLQHINGANTSNVTAEALSRKRVNSPTNETIFSRKSIRNNAYDQFGFDNALLKTTSDDSLVLTRAYESNNKIAKDVFNCIEHLHYGVGSRMTNDTAKKIMEDNNYKLKVLELLKQADLFIQDLSVMAVNMPDDVLNSLPFKDAYKKSIDRTGYQVTTTHLIHDEAGNVISTRPFSMDQQESMGTKRIFELAYPLIEVLEHGSVLYMDEFEMFLHPKECEFILNLFNSEHNPNGAQLIINTHMTTLMDQVGKNNVYLIGKNGQEESIIGKLPSSLRADDSVINKKYMNGFLGALPNIEE